VRSTDRFECDKIADIDSPNKEISESW